MPLPITKVNYVNNHDLDDFIHEIYGHDFSFISDQGPSSKCEFFFHVSPVPLENFESIERKKMEMFINSGQTSWTLTQGLLNNLCFRKLIAPGSYIIFLK